MTADMAVGRPPEAGAEVGVSALLPLALREAARLMTSPALLVFVAYVVLFGGFGALTDFSAFADRAVVAAFTAMVAILLGGLMAYASAHLVASSARRSGADAQLAAAPTDGLRRDLGLILGVALGPCVAVLALCLVSWWAAATADPAAMSALDAGDIGPWRAVDVAQVLAMVLGAGTLGVVVARWLPFPGSWLIGFVGMIFVATGLTASGRTGVDWFAWFTVTPWFTDLTTTPTDASLWWHAAYLFAWSVVGVCALGVRQAAERRPWVVALGGSLVLVGVTGWLQLATGVSPPINL